MSKKPKGGKGAVTASGPGKQVAVHKMEPAPSTREFIDMKGRVYGHWTVLHLESKIDRKWICRCSCGTTKSVSAVSLRRGVSQSCGCTSAARNRAVHTTHGMTHSIEFRIWRAIRARCNSKKNPHYGGRGIRICQRWHRFTNFYADMGKRPSDRHSIERKNNNGNYTKRNCRWATRGEQNINTSTSRIWIVRGQRFPSSSIAAARFAVNQATIVRWCNGFFQDGTHYPPKPSCASVLKYKAVR